MNRQPPTSLLLATDRLASPLLEAGSAWSARITAYTPYGYRPGGQQVLQSRMGFTGQLREPELGWYILGNGYRAYNPILMRFHSPDRLSPFEDGGINAYAYCSGDPVNSHDPTGQMKRNKNKPKLGIKISSQDFSLATSEAASHAQGTSSGRSTIGSSSDGTDVTGDHNQPRGDDQSKIHAMEAVVSKGMALIVSQRQPGASANDAEKKLFNTIMGLTETISALKVERSDRPDHEGATRTTWQHDFPQDVNNNNSPQDVNNNRLSPVENRMEVVRRSLGDL